MWWWALSIVVNLRVPDVGSNSKAVQPGAEQRVVDQAAGKAKVIPIQEAKKQLEAQRASRAAKPDAGSKAGGVVLKPGHPIRPVDLATLKRQTTKTQEEKANPGKPAETREAVLPSRGNTRSLPTLRGLFDGE